MANKSDKINISLYDMTDEDKNTLFSLIRKYSDRRKTKRYIPGYGEQYWYISMGFNVYKATYQKSEVDKNIVYSRNVFTDYESAAFEAKRRKIICELQDFADKHNEDGINWNYEKQKKYYIYFSYKSNELSISNVSYVNWIGNDLFFTSYELAEEAIEHVGGERIKKYVFGIGDEENEES